MSGTTAIEGVELDGFIKAQAHLEHAPNDVDGVVRALSLPDVDAWKRVEQGWRARMGEDEHLADVVEIFLRDYIAELRGPSAEGANAADGGADVPLQPVRQEMASYMQGPSAPAPVVHAPPTCPVVAAPVAPPPLVAPLMAPAERARVPRRHSPRRRTSRTQSPRRRTAIASRVPARPRRALRRSQGAPRRSASSSCAPKLPAATSRRRRSPWRAASPPEQ